MKRIFPLLVIITIALFLFGCGKEQSEDPSPVTGEVIKIDEIIERPAVEEVQEEVIEEEVHTVRLCHDTDNGIIRWVAGSVTGYDNKANRFEYNDFCLDKNYLVEYHCDEDEIPQNFTFLCRNGCVDNQCQ